MIMKAEKSHDLPYASWGPRKVGGVWFNGLRARELLV